MASDDDGAGHVERLLETANLADALESDRFRQFLDHVPFAVAVAVLGRPERIVYANAEFERLTGLAVAAVDGASWDVLPAGARALDGDRRLAEAIEAGDDFLGTFVLPPAAGQRAAPADPAAPAADSDAPADPDAADAAPPVDAWSNVIENDDGTPLFRLVALSEVRRDAAAVEALARTASEKDVQLRELQHRVKNNLQMITALIRLEARNLPDGATGARFDRLAGRIEALAILYRALDGAAGGTVDLGVYLTQIATAVIGAHAVEGIRLDLKVDTWPVSVNVAMPTGLVVNELLTNTLKHAFAGRDGGTITLRGLVDEAGCRVTVADDGVGLPEGAVWPAPGKLSALIVQSLRQNAKATVDFASEPGKGVKATIFFARENAA